MYEVSGKLTVILITMWFLQNLGGRLAERKEVAQMFDRERFNLSKLNDLGVWRHYYIRSQTGLQLGELK